MVKTVLLQKQFLPVAFVYLLFIFLLQLTNGWYQNFSDAVHYLWIADKYAEGDWQNAVNTYWGPMISWLLLLLKPLIGEPFVRFRILQLLLGFTALLLINTILRKKFIDRSYCLLFTLLAVPLLVSFAWFYLTPDLLLLNGVLLCMLFFSWPRDLNWKQALLTALVGALLFYIKSVGLYMFLLVLAGKLVFVQGFRPWRLLKNFLSVIVLAIANKNYRPWKPFFHFLLTIFFLAILCAPWIRLISWKHGSFTMGTSSGHNFKMNAPRITPDIYGEVGNPYHLGTLTEPNPANAFDACVEHAHQPYLSWEGMSKKEIAVYYSEIIYKNLKSARSMYFGLDIGTIFCLLMIIAYIVHRRMMWLFLVQNNVFLLIFFANLLLYLPFFLMDRYTWPGLIAFYVLSILALFHFPVLHRKWMILTVSALFLLLNCHSLYKEYQYSLPEKPITEQIWKTKQELKMDRTIWLCGKNDKRLGLVKGLIYYNKGQYLGALFSEESTPESIAKQLKNYRINTIVTLENPVDSLLPKEGFKYEQVLKSPAVNAFRIAEFCPGCPAEL